MRIGWLIDADMFEGYRDDLVAGIRACGHEVKLIRPPAPPYRWEDVGCSYRETFPPDACVVVHGDIELVARVYRERRWTPGVFGTMENFACSSYYCFFGKYLLNQDYVMLPFGELARRKDFLFEVLGREGQIFVRPDSPLKLFTGQVARRDTFTADLEFMGFYEFPPSSLVLVTTPKRIRDEWRFVVANKQVVAGCQYKIEEQLDLQPRFEAAAHELAATIAAEDYHPDPVWVMDICRTDDGRFHLLEIGGFSSSDLYACDKAAIASAVCQAALVEWERANDR
jgi:hypothetical protein